LAVRQPAEKVFFLLKDLGVELVNSLQEVVHMSGAF
jgi:hypothetical protein